jgi:predicted acetyltransferase
MALTVRTLTEDDYQAFSRMVFSAFLQDPHDSDVELERALFDLDRVYGAFDGAEIVGSAGVFTRSMTLPGAGQHPVAAVTSVAVRPAHRRRGAMSMLMRDQLHLLHDSGLESFAALWASEGGIYGRFGYGMAAEFARLRIPRGAKFLDGVDIGTERVREVPRDEALPLMKEIYDRVAPTRTGWLDRTDAAWAYHLRDEEHHRDGQSAYRFVLHPKGYAVYRAQPGSDDRGPRYVLHVRELTAVDSQAYAALHRYLLDVDWVSESTFFTGSDEPVKHLLVDPRQVLRRTMDSLWVRLVDLDRALVLRRYLSDVDAVLEVTDALCPWNAGRWRLTVKSGEATVQRVSDEPDVALDIAALGAVFLGGTRLAALAAAQRVRELTPGSVTALSHAFAGERDPHCPEDF